MHDHHHVTKSEIHHFCAERFNRAVQMLNEDEEEKRKRLMEEKQDLEQRVATLTARGEHQSDELEPPCSPRNNV